MSEIGTELSADCKILNRINLGVHCREHLILLVLDRVLAHVHNRVLACASPIALGERSQTAVLGIRTPVRQHEAAGRNWSNGGVAAIVGLLCLLVSSHCVGAYLKPLACLDIGIGTKIITAEGRVLCNTVLVVESTRYVIVQAVGGTIDRKLVALERSTVVEHLVKPVDINLREKIVVLAGIQSYFLLELYALIGVHHHPVVLSQLRETVLGTKSNLGIVKRQATLRCDYNHTIGSTRTIDRCRGSVLQYRDALDVVRTEGVEVGT